VPDRCRQDNVFKLRIFRPLSAQRRERADKRLSVVGVSQPADKKNKIILFLFNILKCF
jgi:hypothetical protein